MTDKNIIDIKNFQNNKNSNKSITKSQNDLDIQIAHLKANGIREMDIYKELVNKFIEDVKKLSIFKDIFDNIADDQIRFFLIDELLDSLIKPIFEGEKPPFIAERDYRIKLSN
jgi:hypothetical protein